MSTAHHDTGGLNVVARGLLDMAAGAWVGSHPGFTNVLTDNGPGDFTVHLDADGAPATMWARCSVIGVSKVAAQTGPLGGVGNRDFQVLAGTWGGVDSNPAGWTPGTRLATNPVLEDNMVIIEMINFA